MALSFVASSTWVAGTGSVQPTLPTGAAVGDLLVIFLFSKYEDAVLPSEPEGWTSLGVAINATRTQAADNGGMRARAFYRVYQTGDGGVVFSPTPNNMSAVHMTAYRVAAGKTYDVAAFMGADDTTGSPLLIAAAGTLGLTTDDILHADLAVNGDVVTYSTSTPSATGATFGALVTNVMDTPFTQGTDARARSVRWPITGGPATGNAQVSTTLGGTTTNAVGVGLLLRIREAQGTTTTPVALTATSSATSSLTKRLSAKKALTATTAGTVSLLKRAVALRRTFAIAAAVSPFLLRRAALKKAFTHTANGTATLTRRPINLRTLTATASSVASLARKATRKRTLAAVASNVSTLTRKVTAKRAFTPTSTGVATLTKVDPVTLIQRTLSATSSVIATLTHIFTGAPPPGGNRTARVRAIRSTVVATNLGALDAYGTATTTPTTTTVGQFTSTSGSQRYRNATTSVAASPPAVGTASTGEGWRDSAAEHANDIVRYNAGTWTTRTKVRKTGQTLVADVTARITVILYRVSSTGTFISEIGRSVSADTLVSTADLNISSSFTTTVETVLNAGDRLQTEIYIQNIVAGSVLAPTAPYNLVLLQDQNLANTGTAISAQPNYKISYVRAITVTAAHIVSLVRGFTVKRALTAIANGVSTFRKKTTKRITVTSTGVASFRRKTLKIRAATAIGTATFRRKVGKILTAATSAEVATVARRIALRRSIAASSTGVAFLTRIARRKRTLTATGTGVGTLARKRIFKRTLTALGTGTATFRRKTTKFLTRTAVGTAFLTRRLSGRRTFSATSTGVTSIRRYIRKRITATATGVSSLVRKLIMRRALTAVATGVGTVRRKTTKRITAVGTGVPAFARKLVGRRTFTATATGTASIVRRSILARLLHAATITKAKALIKIPFEKLPIGDGSVINVVKKIFSVFDD